MNELEIPNAETLAAFAELDNGDGEWFNGSTKDYIAKLLETESPQIQQTDSHQSPTLLLRTLPMFQRYAAFCAASRRSAGVR